MPCHLLNHMCHHKQVHSRSVLTANTPAFSPPSHLCPQPPHALLPPRHLSYPLQWVLPPNASVCLCVCVADATSEALSQSGHLRLLLFSLCSHPDCASCLMHFLTSETLLSCLLSAVKSCSCKRSDNQSASPLWHRTCIFLSWTAGGNCHHQPWQCLKSSPSIGAALGVLAVYRAS